MSLLYYLSLYFVNLPDRDSVIILSCSLTHALSTVCLSVCLSVCLYIRTSMLLLPLKLLAAEVKAGVARVGLWVWLKR